MSELIPAEVYRLAHELDQVAWRGLPVVFKRYREAAYPIPYRRAVVSLFDGQELVVTPGSLIAY